MVDILEFVVDITLKLSIFYQISSESSYDTTQDLKVYYSAIKWGNIHQHLPVLPKWACTFWCKMCNVANTQFLDNFCGRYFGRYNAVWSIFGLFLLWSIFITTPLAALYLSRDVKVYHSAIKWRNTKISANILFNMYLLGNRICNSSAILNIRTFVAKCVML